MTYDMNTVVARTLYLFRKSIVSDVLICAEHRRGIQKRKRY